MYDKQHAVDLESEMIWNKVTLLRQMNHPNLPVFHWVYHTRPSLYRDRVVYDATREYHYIQTLGKKAAPVLDANLLRSMMGDLNLDPLIMHVAKP